MIGLIYLFVCLSVCLSIHPSIYLSNLDLDLDLDLDLNQSNLDLNLYLSIYLSLNIYIYNMLRLGIFLLVLAQQLIPRRLFGLKRSTDCPFVSGAVLQCT